jgi:hypothetical protein
VKAATNIRSGLQTRRLLPPAEIHRRLREIPARPTCYITSTKQKAGLVVGFEGKLPALTVAVRAGNDESDRPYADHRPLRQPQLVRVFTE